jgi:hypothetical protein
MRMLYAALALGRASREPDALAADTVNHVIRGRERALPALSFVPSHGNS